MKKLLPLLFATLLFSCAPPQNQNSNNQNSNDTTESEATNTSQFNTPVYSYSDTKTGISVQVIDSCEYIYCEGSGVAITHKHNCRFCKARKEQEVQNQ